MTCINETTQSSTATTTATGDSHDPNIPKIRVCLNLVKENDELNEDI